MTHPLYTIGHSNHPIGYFLALLAAHRIALVCDVRTVPHSRFHPQYNRRYLGAALEEAEIAYLYLGAALGGKPRAAGLPEEASLRFAAIAGTEEFREGMRRLGEEARLRRTAILCAERDPADCHRSLLICPHLPADLPARHILADGSLRGDGTAGGVEDEEGQRPLPP